MEGVWLPHLIKPPLLFISPSTSHQHRSTTQTNDLTTNKRTMKTLQNRASALALVLLSLSSDHAESFGRHCIQGPLHTSQNHMRLSPITSTTTPTSRSTSTTALSAAANKKKSAAAPKETDTEIRDRILAEIDSGMRQYPSWISEYGEPEDELALDDDDDDAIDAATLGQWDEKDLEDKFDYEWDPDEGDEDPNNLDPAYEYAAPFELDEEGIEVGYDPVFGRSNPIDGRTILNPPDSYVIDAKTRDDSLVPQDFPDGDPEIKLNDDITALRKSLKIVETHTDPFLKMEVPNHAAKWHGYPEQLSFPKQDYMNNRFTKPEDATDFDKLGPARARQLAVQLARSRNNEWLPEGTSEAYHASKTAIYKEKGVITGSTLPGQADPALVAKIQPALDVLGDVVELLSIEVDTVFRFKYHGLIKNKRGMEAWAGVLIRNCDVDCTGVVFETGFRKRDPYYDGGSHWYGPY